jgi:hypothetical protein
MPFEIGGAMYLLMFTMDGNLPFLTPIVLAFAFLRAILEVFLCFLLDLHAEVVPPLYVHRQEIDIFKEQIFILKRNLR